MVFTPIHRALDLEPSDLTFELLDQAVAAHVREADDLDWKLTLPQDSGDPKWRDEFAKDVAAMANSGGGWLVYGVREDRKTSAATAVEGVSAFNQGVEQRLRGVAHGHIRPAVPELRFYAVSEPGRSDVLALHVPTSLDVPHLVAFGEQAFGAPHRSGAQTQWMSERDLERSYRARFTGQHDRESALDKLLEAQMRAVTRDLSSTFGPLVMFVAAAVPLEVRRPTERSAEDARAVFEEADLLVRRLGGLPNEPTTVYPPRRGMRRYTAEKEDRSVSIHLDGSVSMHARLRRPQHGLDGYGFPVLSGIELEVAVARLVATIAALARSMQLSGPHIARAEVRWGPAVALRYAFEDPQVRDYGHLVDPPIMVEVIEPVAAEIHGDSSIADLTDTAREIALDFLHQGGITRPRYLA